MYKETTIFAGDLKFCDQFRINQYSFSPIYTVECIFGDHIYGVDARTERTYHRSVNKTELVYKIEEVN